MLSVNVFSRLIITLPRMKQTNIDRYRLIVISTLASFISMAMELIVIKKSLSGATDRLLR
jgi:hypothetical protein